MAFLKIIQNVKVATHFEEASDSLLFREIPFLKDLPEFPRVSFGILAESDVRFIYCYLYFEYEKPTLPGALK